ncbi:MAG: hypothetical protein C0469_08960 [Cyanobacteria bacterium DS2.3.42]|nr:hypothetical protein [Cyanobacteria bacterium DS2.3.42]
MWDRGGNRFGGTLNGMSMQRKVSKNLEIHKTNLCNAKLRAKNVTAKKGKVSLPFFKTGIGSGMLILSCFFGAC